MRKKQKQFNIGDKVEVTNDQGFYDLKKRLGQVATVISLNAEDKLVTIQWEGGDISTSHMEFLKYHKETKEERIKTFSRFLYGFIIKNKKQELNDKLKRINTSINKINTLKMDLYKHKDIKISVPYGEIFSFSNYWKPVELVEGESIEDTYEQHDLGNVLEYGWLVQKYIDKAKLGQEILDCSGKWFCIDYIDQLKALVLAKRDHEGAIVGSRIINFFSVDKKEQEKYFKLSDKLKKEEARLEIKKGKEILEAEKVKKELKELEIREVKNAGVVYEQILRNRKIKKLKTTNTFLEIETKKIFVDVNGKKVGIGNFIMKIPSYNPLHETRVMRQDYHPSFDLHQHWAIHGDGKVCLGEWQLLLEGELKNNNLVGFIDILFQILETTLDRNTYEKVPQWIKKRSGSIKKQKKMRDILKELDTFSLEDKRNLLEATKRELKQ